VYAGLLGRVGNSLAGSRWDLLQRQSKKAPNPRRPAKATVPTLMPALNPVVCVTGVFTAVLFPVALEVGVVLVELFDVSLSDVVFEALVEVVLVVVVAMVVAEGEVTKPVLVLWRPLTEIIV